MKHLRSITSSQTPAMESIKFQDGSFFRDLTAVIEPYVSGSVPLKNEREVLSKKISSVIKKYTNLSIHCQWGSCYAITIADWFKDHVLMDRVKTLSNEEDSRHLLDKSNQQQITGKVDLINARVDGFFAEQSFTLFIAAAEFVNKQVTAKQHAASILHEVGHAFTMCEMIDRVVSTNQILSRVHRELLETDPVKRKVSIQKAGKELKLSDKTIESAASSNNAEVATTVLLTGLLKESSNNTASPYYNAFVAEQMADEFVVRMGGGADLVKNLDVIRPLGTDIQKRTAANYYVLEFIKTTLSTVGIVLVPIWLMTLVWIMSESTDSGAYHDAPYDRIKRVRNQILEGMKNFNLSKEVVKDYQEQLMLIDAVFEQYNNRQQWWGIVSDYLFNYSGVKDKEFQEKLEALSSNELFSGALSIKHM